MSDLEKSVLALMQSDLAQDMLIRALIQTHPNREALLLAFQRISADHASTLIEKGFERGASAESSKDLLAEMNRLSSVWSRWIRSD